LTNFNIFFIITTNGELAKQKAGLPAGRQAFNGYRFWVYSLAFPHF
jgi:hypothetical protein